MAKLPEPRIFVRIGALSGIDNTLHQLGVDPEPVLAAHGLSRSMLAEGDRLIFLEQAAALLEHAARETNCPHFAIELAALQNVNLLGAIGLLLQTADTVREALRDIELYLRTTHVSHIHWNLRRRGTLDSFEVSTDLPTITVYETRLILELAVAQCYRIMQSLSGGRLRIARVCFRHRYDENTPKLRRFFSARVQVDSDFDGLMFEPGAVDIKIPQADTQVHESVRRLILEQNSSLSEDSFAGQVKVLIRPLLPTGQCTIERIARCFACDKRTLQRYLREKSGTTYQQLLNEVRFEVACFYLKESGLPITQLAQLAGFNEPTNFSRAFRRHFGLSPRQWCQAHGIERRPRKIRS